MALERYGKPRIERGTPKLKSLLHDIRCKYRAMGGAVGVNGKFVRSKVDRSGVVQTFGVGRIGARRCTRKQKTCKGQERLQHESITKWLARGFRP